MCVHVSSAITPSLTVRRIRRAGGRQRSKGHSALALTDHEAGAMEMAHPRPLGIRPITGAELTLDDGTHLTLLCETRGCEPLPGAHRLTLAHPPLGAEAGPRRRPPGPARRRAQPAGGAQAHAAGLVCLSGCARAARSPRAWRRASAEAAAVARRLAQIFGPDRFRIELQRPFWRHDRRRNRLLELAERSACPRSPPATSTCTRASGRAPGRDGRRGLGKALDEDRATWRGNIALTARSGWPALPRASRRGGRDRPAQSG